VGKYQKIAVILFSASAMTLSAACQKSEVANGSANTTVNKAAANTTNTSNAAANTAPATSGSIDLSTPTAAYKTAYNARNNKDIPTLKRVLSKDVLQFLTEIGDTGDKDHKSLDEMLKDLCEQPQAPTADARNEMINGDKATIEYLDETGSWHPMELIKENGDWKITIGKADKPPVDDSNGSGKSKDKK
jgi:predicted lipid-binding transport protein (Tim44 family)